MHNAILVAWLANCPLFYVVWGVTDYGICPGVGTISCVFSCECLWLTLVWLVRLAIVGCFGLTVVSEPILLLVRWHQTNICIPHICGVGHDVLGHVLRQ